ncbi:hypothetical protein [Rhodoplanes azumiensis]|uniref:Uncharacterized protein n=1 Tax=Rhodoplanes azumiensis TaxID=1897628 RepID=A0ABW5AG87_9BRAD
MNEKTERQKPTTRISGMAFENIRPLASIKPVDPFKRPVFSNPRPVGEKPKPAGTADPGSNSSDDKR